MAVSSVVYYLCLVISSAQRRNNVFTLSLLLSLAGGMGICVMCPFCLFKKTENGIAYIDDEISIVKFFFVWFRNDVLLVKIKLIFFWINRWLKLLVIRSYQNVTHCHT